MVKSALFLASWGAITFGVVIAAGALFGARPAAAGPGVDDVRWPLGQTSVEVCADQHGRPPWITGAGFSSVVSDAAEWWSDLDAGMRIDYLGECGGETASAVDGVVEVAWDLGTFLDRPGVDSVTTLETIQFAAGAPHRILGARVALRPWLIGPTATPTLQVEALRGLVGHEFGHLLGLPHSDSQLDLMYEGPITARGPSIVDGQTLLEIYWQ